MNELEWSDALAGRVAELGSSGGAACMNGCLRILILAAVLGTGGCERSSTAQLSAASARNAPQSSAPFPRLPNDVMLATTNRNPDIVARMKLRIQGGLGLALSPSESGFLKIWTVASNSPASQAGLRPGDYVTHVDNRCLSNVVFTQAVDWVRGFNGTMVELTVQPSLTATSRVVRLRRISSLESRERFFQ
jgi:hypothetical protein